MTPIPATIMQVIDAETPKDYDRRETGFSVTVGKIIAENLKVPHYEWHKYYTSIDRFEMILNASLALATIYKSELQQKATLPSASDDGKN